MELKRPNPAPFSAGPQGRVRGPRLLWTPFFLIGAVILVATPVVHADDQPTLDDLLDLTPGPAESEPAEPGDADRPANSEGVQVEIEASVRDRLENNRRAGDAFKQAVNEMDRVSIRLGRGYDSGIETQRMQESILRKLDQVIEAAKQQQQSSSSSSGGSGSSGSPSSASNQDNQAESVEGQNQDGSSANAQASRGSTPSAGGAGRDSVDNINVENGEGPSMEELRDQWGSLPPRLRDELSEGLNERFSPVYRTLTERYYRRLAEEQE